MKCSYQSVYKFDQASLQIESGCETGKFLLVQGGCVFQAHTSPDHKSLEGGGLENLARRVVKLFARVSHQVDVHEDMQGKLQLMTELEMSERILRTDAPSVRKISLTRWCHRYMGTGVRPDSWSDSPVTHMGNSFFRLPGLVVVRILYQYDFGVERNARRFFRGVHEHAFARYRIHQAAH